MVFRWLKFCVVGALLAPYAMTLAQEISTVDLVKGNYGKYATTLKLADLPDGYAAVRLSVANTDPLRDLLPLFTMGGSTDPAKMSAEFRVAQVYWSNGDVVTSQGRPYLVTYKVDWDVLGSMTRGRSMESSSAQQPTEQPMLKIDLVSLNAIEGVEPCPNITKKDLVGAFGDGKSSLEYPGMTGSRQATTLSNEKQIALGMLMYTNDFDDWLPYTQSSKATWYVEYPYVKNLQIFNTLNPNGGMIRFNMGISGVYSPSIPDPANTVLVYESEAWPDGRRAVAFADGHAKFVSQSEWEELSKHLTPKGTKRAKVPLPASYDVEFDKLPNTTHRGSP